MRRRLDWLIPSWLENVDAFNQSSNVDMGVLFDMLILNILLFTICVLSFIVIRSIYPSHFHTKSIKFPNQVPPPMPTDSYLGWIIYLWNIDERTVLEKAGYDVVFFIRFYRLALQICAYFSIYGLCVLLPINWSTYSDANLNSFDSLSMSSIPQQSPLLWYHTGGMFILTIISLYMLEEEYVVYTRYRHMYLRQRRARTRTIIVQDVPSNLRSNITLRAYFETLYPGQVHNARLCIDTRVLDEMISDRLKAVTTLERTMYNFKRTGVRPSVLIGGMSYEVDSIRYHRQLISALNNAIAKEKERLMMFVEQANNSSRQNAVATVARYVPVEDAGSLEYMLSRRGSIIIEPISSRLEPQNCTFSDPRVDVEFNSGEDSSLPPVTRRISYYNWCCSILSSTSAKDCWNTIKRGRTYDPAPLNESTALISSCDSQTLFLSKGFVTFNTFSAATCARQVVHTRRAGKLTVSECPESNDILWDNMYVTRINQMMRVTLVEIVVTLLIVAWIAPVTVVSLVVSSSSIRSYSDTVNMLCERSSFVLSIVESMQPLALLVLMSLLPPILTALGIFEGIVSVSRVQAGVFKRYFNFQVINVLLVTTIAGSVVDALSDILKSPSSAFELLGASLPAVGGFFTEYIMWKAFTGLGMELMRVVGYAGHALKYLTPDKTPRDKDAVYLGIIRNITNAGWLPIDKIYAQDMVVVVVSMTYANISPILLLMSMCYFFLAGLVYKHQMLYIYDPVFETGGKMYPLLAERFSFGLIIAQCTMVGMMVLKESYDQIYALGALLVITLVYSGRGRMMHSALADQLPLEVAASLDLDQYKYNGDGLNDINEFTQPSLRVPGKIDLQVEKEVLGFEEFHW